MFTHIHIYLDMYICRQMNVCVYTYLLIHVNMQTNIRVCAYIYVIIHVHMHTHERVCIYICIIHVNMQTNVCITDKCVHYRQMCALQTNVCITDKCVHKYDIHTNVCIEHLRQPQKFSHWISCVCACILKKSLYIHVRHNNILKLSTLNP